MGAPRVAGTRATVPFMTPWEALRERFLFTGGEAVERRDEWLTTYRARYPAPLPAGYLDLLDTFGPGTFVGFLHVVPPHRLATYGDRMRSVAVAGGVGDPAPWWDRKMVFARTDNGDALMWDIGGGDAVEILCDGEEELEPFAGSFEAFVRTCADGKLGGEPVVRPWFTPARRSQYVRLRFQGDRLPHAAAMDAWCEQQGQALGVVLLDRGDSTEEGGAPWCTRVLHVPGADAVVHVQGVGGRNCWWDVHASGAAGFPERDVRELVTSGGELGWPESAGAAFDTAERDVHDPGY